MSFSRNAADNFLPMLSRLVLAAAFIPAGWDKIMGEPRVYSGQEAQTLQKLGVGEPVNPEGLTFLTQDALPTQEATETGRLSDRIPPPEKEQTEDAGQPTPAPVPPVRTPPPDPEPEPQPQPDPGWKRPAKSMPATPPPTKQIPGSRIQPDPDEDVPAGPQVRARRLYGVALELKEHGWKDRLKPQWMAWAAAGAELLGGALILVGIFSRLWGLGLAVTMAFAFWLTSLGAVLEFGLPSLVVEHLPEFNQAFAQLGLFVLALGVMMTGAGGFSLDRLLFRGGEQDEEHLLHLG